MFDVTRILSQIESGDPSLAEQLLPLVYDELLKLAAAKLAQENPGQTLQATALVHEAYLRLVDQEQVQHWNSRGHFFAAAAEAMRRILVDQARRKLAVRHGGEWHRISKLDELPVADGEAEQTVIIDDLPHPDGPYTNPTANVWSTSRSSMRDFQNLTDSGSPSRSRAPGNNSKKKSASR